MKKALVLLALTCGITFCCATNDAGTNVAQAGEGWRYGGGYGRGYWYGGYGPRWTRPLRYGGYYGYPGYYGGYGYPVYGGYGYPVYGGYGYGGYPYYGAYYGGWGGYW